MWKIFYALYAMLSYYMNFKFEYSDSFELLTGTIITTIILCTLDFFIYKIAFNFTGFMRVVAECDRNEMKLIHWFIRFLLFLIVFAISFTPLPSIILSPLTHSIHIWIIDWINLKLQLISDSFIRNYTK